MNTTELISPADVQEQANAATRDVLAFVDANRIAVTDLDSLTRAHDVRAAIGERQKIVSAQLAKPKAWAHGLHQWLCTLERAALAPLQMLDHFEREQIKAFNDVETRRRLERERVIADARREAEQTRAAAEAAALERAGEHQLAAAVVEEAIAAPAPVVVLTDDVRAVQRFRRRWTFELTDERAVPREFCTVDTVKLGRYATAMKDSGAVPGVRFFYVDDPIR